MECQLHGKEDSNIENKFMCGRTYLDEVGGQMEGLLKLWTLNFAFLHFRTHSRFESLVGARDIGGVISHSMQEAFQD